jgi:peptide/nickel transport system substrate-binding protein
VGDDGVLKNARGEPFTFEILLVTGQDEMASAAEVYIEALKPLGISATLNKVDDAQYKATHQRLRLRHDPLHPLAVAVAGERATALLGRGRRDRTRHPQLDGVNSPAVEAMIAAMLKAPTAEDFTAATRALDRVLTSGRYVIPIWYSDVSRLAYSADLKYPERIPLYGDWTGFLPDIWWYQAK